MPECIFCADEDLPTDTQECPNCGKKPFSGMYFDCETYARAETLEANGMVDEAWTLLYNEWLNHRDINYHDEETGDEIEKKLLELFERHASLVHRRFELCAQTMRIQMYWAAFASEQTLKDGMKAMLACGRDDLAAELVDIHAGVDAQGGFRPRNAPSEKEVTAYVEFVRKELHQKG
jgi:hypothetical protein